MKGLLFREVMAVDLEKTKCCILEDLDNCFSRLFNKSDTDTSFFAICKYYYE